MHLIPRLWIYTSLPILRNGLLWGYLYNMWLIKKLARNEGVTSIYPYYILRKSCAGCLGTLRYVLYRRDSQPRLRQTVPLLGSRVSSSYLLLLNYLVWVHFLFLCFVSCAGCSWSTERRWWWEISFATKYFVTNIKWYDSGALAGDWDEGKQRSISVEPQSVGGARQTGGRSSWEAWN